jgi:ubiquinone/menaquinone biosynthesis C-methylase UbiE
VAQQIKALNQQSISILDVGGGSGAIKEFLSPEEYRLCILDINAEALRRVSDSKLEVIAGDGCRLPFRDNSFDVVLSVDSLEHVPDAKKADYCHELKRVTRRCVIIHCPADSSDGRFKGTAYDTKFLRWYKQRFKKDETNTAEHIRLGLPRVEELMRLFPRVAIAGKQNTWVWLRYMRWGYTPYVRLVVGLLYKLCLISKDNLPPCHACLLVWKKE